MMLTDLIAHLVASGELTGYAFTDWRDDLSYPFNSDTKICLIRIQGGSQDRDIGAPSVDIYLYTVKNATNADREALLNTAEAIDRYLTTATVFANVQHIDMTTSSAGAYKDGQERYFTTHRITVRRSGV